MTSDLIVLPKPSIDCDLILFAASETISIGTFRLSIPFKRLLYSFVQRPPGQTGSKEAADKLEKNIRRKTVRRYSAEEKIRIILAGLSGEVSLPI